jgi:L,D-transpeptidase catalytic domain/Putative peptidoglycan binding domain
MRRVVLALVVGGLVGAPPAWGAGVTLVADHRVARYNDSVRFRGTLPTSQPQPVLLLRDGAVVGATTATGGTFVFDLRLRRAGRFAVRSAVGESPPVVVRVQPRLRIRMRGWLVSGRVLPARAGVVVLRSRSRSLRARVGSAGRFRLRVPVHWGMSLTGHIALLPAPGYVRVSRRLRFVYPSLRLGSHGPAVLLLKQRLRELRFALPRVDSGFRYGTYEAVLAFQKVHRLPRSGRVGPRLWRMLRRASIPRPRVRRGDYIEIDKGRQILMEVRDGKVVNVVHASTGATGNTPVGTWRVYREVFGWDWVLYHPMYFLRGFAIHGYPWVPTWPASHGCVRVPMWLAVGLRERWGRGSVIRVYP